jgi:hypothetical protein
MAETQPQRRSNMRAAMVCGKQSARQGTLPKPMTFDVNVKKPLCWANRLIAKAVVRGSPLNDLGEGQKILDSVDLAISIVIT